MARSGRFKHKIRSRPFLRVLVRRRSRVCGESLHHVTNCTVELLRLYSSRIAKVSMSASHAGREKAVEQRGVNVT